MADSSEDEDGPGSSLNLTGFLFGNINEKGELEDSDILDEESKKHLAQLNTLGGLGSLCRDIASDNEEGTTHSAEKDKNSGWVQKDSGATDYSDISELAEEEEDKEIFYQRGLSFVSNIDKDKKSVTVDEDYDEYDADSEESTKRSTDPGFSLPTVVPAASTLSKQEEDRLAMPPPPPPCVATTGSPSSGPVSSVTGDNSRQIQPQAPTSSNTEDPSKQLNLPRTSDGHTVTELFPEFKPGKVLRFSRLFGPSKNSSLPQLWRNAKKRKKKKKKLGEEEPRSLTLNPPKSPPLPRPEDCMSDDEDKLMAPMELVTKDKSDADEEKLLELGQDHSGKTQCEWRYGPAALWYELLGVSDDGSDLDYGFKLKQEHEESIEISLPTDDLPPDECFNMVAQVNWEDDIIWSPDEVKIDLQAQARAGWIPTGTARTAQSYATMQQQILKQLGVKHPALETVLKRTSLAIEANAKSLSMVTKPGVNSESENKKPSTWYSIFPVENEELVYGRWEDNIIWDSEAMSSLPTPSVMLLDPNDENIILGIPKDTNPNKENSTPAQVVKKESKNKSKLIIGKNSKNEDEIEEETPDDLQKDPFNLSNDEYYSAKHNNVESSLEAAMGSNLVQHSTPALALQRPYFPTYMSPQDLRMFHHVPLKRPTYGPLSKPGRHCVYGLLKHIKKKAREREKERLASGGGEMFFMRTPADLTGTDGDLVLAEYCEEYAPLIMAVGMNTRIRNYFKRKPGSKEDSALNLPYGEDVPVHQLSPFLGQLKPGEHISAFENNLFRAPIYHHQMPESDFLVIRNPNGFFIRNLDTIYLVGQECPKFEVPGPNSKKANIHSRDFLQVFIYRLFWKSQDTPRRIKMEDIKRAFSNHSESSIRKRLKLCADFKRTGVDCNWWVLKSDFRLPTEEEMRAMVSPEQCCAYYSMLAAEQRLKDAGYGEKSFFSPEDDNDDNDNKVDDEVRCAPWNTTRAFISAMRGKCQLAVTGAADPTGCGEGFSYIRVPNKPMATKQQDESSCNSQQIRKQKTVTGTDADLRRLSLKQARQVLRNFGVSEEEIKKLSRWEVIDVVRTMSTEAAKSGEEGMSKFARGSRFTIAEHQERYKEECQRIFELQNKVLSSTEVLSTDEESSSEEGSSDIDELGKNLESMLSSKKTGLQLTHEQEEEERQKLKRLLSEDKPFKESNGNGNGKSSTSSQKEGVKRQEDDDSNSIMSTGSSVAGRRLLIQRTFRTPEGREYARTEVVKNQAVIDAYLRVVNKDKRDDIVRNDEVHKEEIRREKRRIQEQLRRIKRNQEKEKLQPVKKKKEKPPSNVRLKCGACGAIGHMRTNKNCPLYQEANPGSVTVAMTDEQVAEEELNMPQDDLVKVEGTKITLGKAFLESTQELKRKALVLRFPKESVRKKRRSGVLHCDYLKRPHKSINRRRANPEVALHVIFETIINKMKEVEESWVFHQPVSAKSVPDYYKVVKHPMDLQTIKENIRAARYQTREEFLEHCSMIVSNSVLYNGAKNTYTETAQKMLDLCNKMLNEKEDEIISLEKDINPLLSDDSQIALSWVLENVVAQMRAMQESWPFHKPVSSKHVKDYYEVVKSPMDLEKLRQQVQDHYYRGRDEFLEHVRLLHSNSALYNGPEHEFTATAEKLVKFAEEELKENEDYLAKLESEIVADDSSSYIAESQPPSVMSLGGLESAENSMDGFPDISRDGDSAERDSFMDVDDVTRDGFSNDDDTRNISTPLPGYQDRSAVEEEDVLVDIEGSGDEDSMLRKLIPFEEESTRESGVPQFSQEPQIEENFDSILLQDLQHSDSGSDSESDEDDFPFGDGDEEEDEEELEEEMEDVPDASEAQRGEEESRDSFQFSSEIDIEDTAGNLSDDDI